MRHALVGMFLVLLALPASLLAQIRGEVESIGFGGNYRPNCWTPIVVRLRTAGLKNDFYQLQIVQEDLDRDRAVYTRTIGVDTSQTEQRFFAYFIPTPNGLSNSSDSYSSLDLLRKQLRVEIAPMPADPSTRGRPIGQLALTQVPTSIDGPNSPGDEKATSRGRRLVLVIHDGSSRPAFRQYEGSLGLSEDVTFVMLQPRDLPENALAYDAVDAILWLNADANLLDEAGARRTAAIDQYVRQGGRLVVCQTPERARLSPLAPLLPVEYLQAGATNVFRLETRDHAELQPLRAVARSQGPDVWEGIKSPFRMAAATPKAQALVEDGLSINWPDGTTSPWLVRSVYGLGGVTWVAQDLGDPALTARTTMAGWAYVWDEVFGWANNPEAPLTGNNDSESDKWYASTSRSVDVGSSFLRGMDHGSRGTFLVLLAVVFFILYWIAAGPGSYFALLNWRKRELSWLAFAAAALVATLVTLAVVRLVLRGDAVVKHVTVVRAAPGNPAIASSNIGLYIPNDGAIPVTVGQVAPQALASVAAFAAHPQHQGDATARPPVQGEYVVPAPDETEQAAPVVNFPYRSTLKKVQARWVGELPGRIDGSATLSDNQLRGAEGVLTNNTGVDLQNVYVAFRNASGQTRILFRERWDLGTSFDFARVGNPPVQVTPPGFKFDTDSDRRRFGTPYDPTQGRLPIVDDVGSGRGDAGWTGYWFDPLRTRASAAMAGVSYDVADENFIRVLPLVAMFDLVPTVRKRARDDGERFEIQRRGARQMNLSQVVRNGQMLVLAVSAEPQPLPYPFLVDGDPYGGSGSVLYEFVVPLDRTPPVEPATTAPSSAPAEKLRIEDGG